MYQLNNSELPQALSSIFIKNNQVHNYFTRQASSYHLLFVRTHFKRNTLMFTGPKFWNSLDCSVKQAVGLFVFKRKLKSLLLVKYTL